MNRGRVALLGLIALTTILATAPARAVAGPVYDIKAVWGDTNLGAPDTFGSGPEHEHQGQVAVQVRNIGDAAGNTALTITDVLPAHVKVKEIFWRNSIFAGEKCTGTGTGTVTCVLPGGEVPTYAPAPGLSPAPPNPSPSPTGYMPPIYIEVEVEPGITATGTNTAMVTGGGAAQPDTDTDQVEVGEAQSAFGLVEGSFAMDFFKAAFPATATSRTAGDHPFELRVNFDLNDGTAVSSVDGTREISPHGAVKTVEATLPRGVVANPEATPKCDPVDFAEVGATGNGTGCPSDTQVGYLNALAALGTRQHGGGLFDGPNEILTHIPIYSLVPPKGQVADFGFSAGSFVRAHIYGTPDPGQHYAIKSVTPNISSLVGVRGSEVTFWGVPGDPAHDKFRFYPAQTEGKVAGAPWGSAPIRPFFTNPSDCGFDNGGAIIRADSYGDPGNFTPTEEWEEADNVTGCDDARFRFEPDIALQPTDPHAGAPTGLDVHLKVPQRNDEASEAKQLYAENENVKGIATPPMKKAVVTFPEGMTISPSAAQGLESCTSKQIGMETDSPVECPDSSQYGTLTLHTPILPVDEQPEGFIYIGKQGDNFFHNFLTLYLVIQQPERGILVKIPGKVDLDPNTGQITTTFDELPQFPVSDMQMTLKGGTRAALVNPSTCGSKTIVAKFFSWQDPTTAHPVQSSYEVTEKPDGSPCVNNLGERQFKPQLTAGTANPVGGAYSPFIMRLTRSDEDQEFSQLGLTMPKGLLGKLAGVAMCSDAGVAKAAGRSGEGQGMLEQLDPSCPASSQIGTTEVGAGVGVPLTYVPGKVYLAGPYKGAPLSVVVISPAVVGPFDIGVIAVRTALRIDRETAQVTATSDPFPQIFQGIPVRIRDIRLKLDRPEFTINPTNCTETSIAAHVTGTGGNVASTADDTAADLANRFQVGDCAALSFKPRLSFHLFGGTHRGSHPKLRAVLTMPKGGANIAGASVALPHSEFLDQGHIGTVCTRVQFAAKACPAASVYGHAEAITPLFGYSLSGPVYLRSSSHKLPDLVAALSGPASQPVEVDLDGRIDSVNGGIRTTFTVVPDAPVSKFTLTMKGGHKGLLVNSINLCSKTSRANAKFTGQNGKVEILNPKMQNACSSGKRTR